MPRLVPWLVPLVAALLAHGLGLGGGFVYDDLTDVVEHPVVNGTAPLSDLLAYNYMGSPVGEGANTIRPVTTLLFALLWRGFGPAPLVLHAFALLVYVACVMAAQRVFRLFLAEWPAMLAALVFAVLAIHVEVAASIANSAEALSLLLALVSFHAATRDRASVAALLYLAALLAKESAILLPVLVAWYWLCQEGPRSLLAHRRVLIALVIVAAAYLLARSALLPFGIQGLILAADNPLLDASLAERLWMPFVLLGRYLHLTIAPTELAADYTYTVIPVAPPPEGLAYGIAGLAFTLLALAAMLALRRREDARGLVFALGATFISYALFANAVFLNVTLFAERLFLAPSAWLLLAAASAAMLLRPRGRRLFAVLAAIILATQAPLSAARALDWRTPHTLLAAQVEAQPDSVKGQLYYATLLGRAGQWDEAIWHLAIAADGRRSFPGRWRAPRLPLDLPAEQRVMRLPDLFARGATPLAYFGGLRRVAAETLGPSAASAVDDIVRRYLRATPRRRPRPDRAWPAGSAATGG
jgi:hypothetical protein